MIPFSGPPLPSSRPATAAGERSALVRLLTLCARHRGLCVTATVAAALGGLAATAAPLLQRWLIDAALAGRDGTLRNLCFAGLLGTVGVAFGGSVWRRRAAQELSLRIEHELRTELFAAVLRSGPRHEGLPTPRQAATRAVADLPPITSLLGMGPLLLGNLVLVVGMSVAMLVLSPGLTAVAAGLGLGLWAVSRRARDRILPAATQVQRRVAELVSAVRSVIAGARVVKSFGREAEQQERLVEAARRLQAAQLDRARLTSRFEPTLQALPTLGQLALLALGGWLAVHQRLSVGTYLAFASYLGQLIAPVRMMSRLVSVGQQARAGAIRVFQVLDAGGLDDAVTSAGSVARPVRTPDGGPPGVRFTAVAFAHGGTPVLRHFSLNVAAGETVALVGPPGAGKSTVARLLVRLHDVQEGRVLVGGRDVRELDVRALRSAVGLVPEDHVVFADTVRANISYSRPGATDEEVRAAARAARADEFVRALPQGYDTVLGERGGSLSGGQRQRLGLARVLCGNPSVLVLDDATSAVDPALEAEVNDALRREFAGRTVILIARRRATIRLADRIVVLEEGRVRDSGTHEELLGRCGVYRRLFAPDSATGGGARSPCAEEPALAPPAPAMTPAPLPRATEQLGFLGLLRRYRGPLAACAALVATDAVAGLGVPLLVRRAIDGGVRHMDFGAVAAATLFGLGIVLADWAVNVVQVRLAATTGERLMLDIRTRLYRHLQALGLDYYEREAAGATLSRVTTEPDLLAGFLQTGLVSVTVSALTVLGVGGSLLIIDAELAWVVLPAFPLLVAATIVFRRRIVPLHRRSRQDLTAVNAYLEENAAGAEAVLLAGREEVNTRRFTELSAVFRHGRARAQRLVALYFPLVQLVTDLAAIVILATGLHRMAAGTLSTGVLVAFLLFLNLLFSPVQQLSQLFDSYQQAAVGMRRMRDFLGTPVSVRSPARPVPVGRLRGDIVLDDVRFAFPGTATEVLAGVTLRITAGETVAVVGASGAGKSTLVKLIARLYEVTGGRILVDGVDVRSYDVSAYRRRLGSVPQEPYFFEGSVRDAIGFAADGATQRAVERAAEAVGLDAVIAALPGGYAHRVEEGGTNLSLSRRQLLALARARLADPDILLLDEATSASDAKAGLGGAAPDGGTRRTTVIVTHRPAVAARADRIVVLDRGVVAEDGTHQELLARDGLYAAMWRVDRTSPGIAPVSGRGGTSAE
ncbi:ABC transporter ATP-binding protein [Streptomyces longwoodensis]|uniref:ABC transporter ATP-binding protein n=1 Tax=Streptomyces longwoodensis TaxID=68231 RepID=UPI00131D7EF8|nr:ABC transporter ATP-binding protein [Streptomyces longwoodensis]